MIRYGLRVENAQKWQVFLQFPSCHHPINICGAACKGQKILDGGRLF
jgi:hypothetical protein